MQGTTKGYTAIRKSTPKLIGLALVAAALVAAGLWTFQGGAAEAGLVFWGWLTTTFFGLILILAVHRLVFGHRTQIELSPQGFWDKRTLKQKVPWSAVSHISTWSRRGNSLLRIQMTDEAWNQSKLTFYGKTIRWLHKPIGLDGIYVGSLDLDISFSELRQLFQSYHLEYNSTATDDAK